MPSSRKGISVQVDAALHAEVKEYIEAHGMTMGDFVSLALQNELHPPIHRRSEIMEKQRTIAFTVPESFFQKIKDYLQENHMTQRQFILGLIEAELERAAETQESHQDMNDPRPEEAVSAPVSANEGAVEEVHEEGTETAEIGHGAPRLSEEALPNEEQDEEEEEDEDEDESYTMGM